MKARGRIRSEGLWAPIARLASDAPERHRSRDEVSETARSSRVHGAGASARSRGTGKDGRSRTAAHRSWRARRQWQCPDPSAPGKTKRARSCSLIDCSVVAATTDPWLASLLSTLEARSRRSEPDVGAWCTSTKVLVSTPDRVTGVSTNKVCCVNDARLSAAGPDRHHVGLGTAVDPVIGELAPGALALHAHAAG
jgi:hypothetical protein